MRGICAWCRFELSPFTISENRIKYEIMKVLFSSVGFLVTFVASVPTLHLQRTSHSILWSM